MTYARSKNHPGLLVRRQGFNLTFSYGDAWETHSAKTGALVDFGGPDLPDEIARYVRAEVTRLLPAHRRALVANEMTAPTANQEAVKDTPQEAFIAPIVGAELPTVKENDTTMPIDFSNPVAVKAASAIAMRIKASLGIPELETRRAELRQQNRHVEITYRNAQLDVNHAKRLVADAVEAINQREQELIHEAASAKGDDGKKKHTVDGAKAAAATACKTDDVCIALTAAHAEAVQAHYEAERRLAEAEADQKALVREFDLLVAELALATARVEAFAGLDAEPTPQQPAA